MKIVAFLQNQWFKNPEAVRKIYERHPEEREDLIARFLFMGCKTGRILERVFGDLCDEIVWEEISPEVGGHASAVFPPDFAHIRAVIKKHQPDLVLTFGEPARNALVALNPGVTIYSGPHPCARNGQVIEKLERIRALVVGAARSEASNEVEKEFKSLNDVWKDPHVKAALKDGRSANDIAVLTCPKCGRWGYYNQGSHFWCRFCEQGWHCCMEGEEPPLDRQYMFLDGFTALADTVTMTTDGYENETLPKKS